MEFEFGSLASPSKRRDDAQTKVCLTRRYGRRRWKLKSSEEETQTVDDDNVEHVDVGGDKRRSSKMKRASTEFLRIPPSAGYSPIKINKAKLLVRAVGYDIVHLENLWAQRSFLVDIAHTRV